MFELLEMCGVNLLDNSDFMEGYEFDDEDDHDFLDLAETVPWEEY